MQDSNIPSTSIKRRKNTSYSPEEGKMMITEGQVNTTSIYYECFKTSETKLLAFLICLSQVSPQHHFHAVVQQLELFV